MPPKTRQDRSRWPRLVVTRAADHFAHSKRLLEEALQIENESGLYHLFDADLNFTASRLNNIIRKKWISIWPQPTLEMDDPKAGQPFPQNVEPSDRVTRSMITDNEVGDISFAELSLEDGDISAQFSSASAISGADLSVRIETAKRINRKPDFMSIMTFEKGTRVLFLHEVKRFLPDQFNIKPSPRQVGNPAAWSVKVLMLQCLNQAQFAFADYPEQDVMHVMCMIGRQFRVIVYKRAGTPAYQEDNDYPRLDAIPDFISNVCDIYNEDVTDVSEDYVLWWNTLKDKNQEEL